MNQLRYQERPTKRAKRRKANKELETERQAGTQPSRVKRHAEAGKDRGRAKQSQVGGAPVQPTAR